MGNLEKNSAKGMAGSHKYDKEAATDILGFFLVPLIVAAVEGIVGIFRSFRKNSNQNVQSQEPTTKPKKWTAEDYKNYEDWQARSRAIEEQFQEQIKKIDKKSKKSQALRDAKWQEALEALENGSKKERAESVKKLDKLIDEFWDTL